MVSADLLVSVQLLDPFQVDHGGYPDAQVSVARDVDVVGDDRAVQAFVEQHVRVGGQGVPLGECARLLSVGLGFVVVVKVLAELARPGFAVDAEQLLELIE